MIFVSTNFFLYVFFVIIFCLADLGRIQIVLVQLTGAHQDQTVQLTSSYNFPHMLYNCRTLFEKLPPPPRFPYTLEINVAQ